MGRTPVAPRAEAGCCNQGRGMDPRQAPDDGNLSPESGPVTGIPEAWAPRMPKDSTSRGYGRELEDFSFKFQAGGVPSCQFTGETPGEGTRPST